MQQLKSFIKSNWWFVLIISMLVGYHVFFDQYYIRTGSMEPTINVGAVVIVQKGKMPEVDDITAYESETGKIIVHRVIGTDEDGNYITKGDNNISADPKPVSKEQIKGKVVLFINKLAPLVRRLQNF